MSLVLNSDFGAGTAHHWTPEDLHSNGELIGLLMGYGRWLEVAEGMGSSSVLSIKVGLRTLLLHPNEWLVADPALGGRAVNLHVMTDDQFTVLAASAFLRSKADRALDDYNAERPDLDVMPYEATVHLADTLRMIAWTWKDVPNHVRSSMKAVANAVMRHDRPGFLSPLSEEPT